MDIMSKISNVNITFTLGDWHLLRWWKHCKQPNAIFSKWEGKASTAERVYVGRLIEPC